MSTPGRTPSPTSQQKMSLFEFIEENQRLLTAIAVFIALTAFLVQATATDDALSKSIPGIPLLAALLLTLELFLRIPTEAQMTFRLWFFHLVVLALGISLGWLWVKRFPTAVGGVLVLAIIVLFFLAMALVSYGLYLPLRMLIRQFLDRTLTQREQQWLYLGSTLLSGVLVFGGIHFGMERLSSPPPPPPLHAPATPPTATR